MRISLLAVLIVSLLVGSLAEAKRIKAETIQGELKGTFMRVQWRFFDKKYETIPSEEFVNEFMPFFRRYLIERGLTKVSEGFSARQYAEVFNIQLDIWMRREMRQSKQPACAVMVTDPSRLSGSTPSAWILLNLDGQWAVMDPIYWRLVWLKDFKYRSYINAIQF